MFPYGGSVTPEMQHQSGRLQTLAYTFDISTPVGTDLTRPILYDPDFEIVVHDVWAVYLAANSGTGSPGTIDIGITGDSDAIVAAYSVPTTVSVGDEVQLTLETTLVRPGIFKYGGKPVVAKGVPVILTKGQGASNTSDFTLFIRYSKCVPST